MHRLCLIPSAVIAILGSFLGLTDALGNEGAHYFAERTNFVNKYFVKKGWFWFTVAFVLAVGIRKERQHLQSALRWGAATLWWVLFTQWCFGAPLMDRLFTATGGSCSTVDLMTSRACRSHGGIWSGGHDLSGHVFLLTLSSTTIFFEFIPTIRELRHGRPITLSIWVVLLVQFLNYFMLFFTCAYFHSLGETLTGYLAALSEVLLIRLVTPKEIVSIQIPSSTATETELEESPDGSRLAQAD